MPPEALVLTLPFPPTVNQYWRRVGNKTVLSQRANEFHARAAAEIRLQIWNMREKPEMFREPVGVDVTLHAPDCKIRDLDNYLKASFDCVTHAGVWEDDSLVRELHARWGRNVKFGKLVLGIWRLSDAP